MNDTRLTFTIVLSVIVLVGCVRPKVINLGGIFESRDVLRRAVFAYAVHKQSSLSPTLEFAPLTTTPGQDAFKSGRKVCDLLLGGSVVVFGGWEEPTRSQTRSICQRKHVPHILTSGKNVQTHQPLLDFAFGLFPPMRDVGKALSELVTHFHWKSLIILYQTEYGLNKLQDLIQLSSMPGGPRVVLRKLSSSKNHKPLLREMKETLEDHYHFVIDSDLETSRVLLEQASTIDMVDRNYHYVFTNLDMYTLDLEVYKESGCNVTSLRLVDTQSHHTTQLIQELDDIAEDSSRLLLFPTLGIQTSVAVLYDAVGYVAQAVAKIENAINPVPINCDDRQIWSNGVQFRDLLKSVRDFEGTTGRVIVNEMGERTDYNLHIIELTNNGFQDIGSWNPSRWPHLNVTLLPEMNDEAAIKALENKTLRVTVYLEEPFVMYRQSEKPLSGNNRYEGFCIDLLNEIGKIRRFNYTIYEVKDKAYGSPDKDGNWDGMVGELKRGEADLALASLTISYSRSGVIDFTVPFIHLGISILFKKPVKEDPGLFQFLSPLSLDVWIYIMGAYLGVSLALFITARFSPYEWLNPHPCEEENEEVENEFNLLNSIWFTVGSLMQQGSDLAPKAPSTRLVATIWWLFCLIMISSYTANLAAFLTVERLVFPIESAEDLARQTKIKYGTLAKGSTKSFFQAGDYAYLMESSMLEYYIERDCDLMQVGGLLDSKDSPFRAPISSAILMLQEKTVLTSLKDKWWKQKRGGGQCKGKTENKGKHNELGLQNVGGVFVLLLGGTVLAIFIGLLEFIYKASKNARTDKITLCGEIWREFQSAIRCHGSSRPRPQKHIIVGVEEDEEEEPHPLHLHKYNRLAQGHHHYNNINHHNNNINHYNHHNIHLPPNLHPHLHVSPPTL